MSLSYLFKKTCAKFLLTVSFERMDKNTQWFEPEIRELGEAKDLISLNPFDAKNSLVPSDEFNTTTS